MLNHRAVFIRNMVQEYNSRFQLYDSNLFVYTPKNGGYILLSYSSNLPHMVSPRSDFQSNTHTNPFSHDSNQVNNYITPINSNREANYNYPSYHAANYTSNSNNTQQMNMYPKNVAQNNQNQYNPFYN